MAVSIGAVDTIIVIVYMLVIMLFGIWVGSGGRSSSDYFLGNRSLPWGALLLSVVATETSTVTFLSIPGIAAAMGGNMTFLQITFGYIVGRLFVVYILLPLYFQGMPFTAYEVLELRFGHLSRRLVSALFLLTRNAGDSLRLFLTALVLQIVLGLDLTVCVIAIGIVTIVYTFIGGAKSVIWNDCIQFVIYMFGAFVAAYIIVGLKPGGMDQLMHFVVSENKLRVFDFDLSPFTPGMTFWGGLIGGAFLTGATHGTDQLMVQRYLSARRQSDAALALGISGVVVMLQFAVFLLIGVGLASLSLPADIKNDQLFAHFVVNHMPVGLLGITLAAVFAAAMSTLSSSLNSSSAVFIKDHWFYFQRDKPSDYASLRAGRIATVGFGILQIGIAVVFGLVGTDESTVANVLKIAGFAAGPVLGLYLLGVFVPMVKQSAALIGFVVGVLTLSMIAYSTPLHWAWYAITGTLATMIGGMVAQAIVRADTADV